TIASPKQADKRLLRTINRLGMMEIIEIDDPPGGQAVFARCEAATEDADENLYKIDFILNLMNILAPERQGFIEGLSPVPLVTTSRELDRLISEFDLEALYRAASELDEAYRTSERLISELETEIAEIEPFRGVPFDLADFTRPAHVKMFFGSVPRSRLGVLDGEAGPWSAMAWEEVAQGAGPHRRNPGATGDADDRAYVVIASLRSHEDPVRTTLAGIGFKEVMLPQLDERVSDRLEELKDSLGRYRERLVEVAGQVRLLSGGKRSGEGRRPLLIVKAYWLNVKNRLAASTLGLRGQWLHVVRGYVRERDVPRFLSVMEQDFPDSVLDVENPGPDDDVPVSLSVPMLFRPYNLLVEMFGLPPYRSFDPTPFLLLNFTVFFGICFSDVCYGILLVAFSAYLSVRTRDFQGVNNFARILLYGGVSSIVFGALMGSWFGDLYRPEYLGENNVMLQLQQGLMVIDPMAKTILALIVALGIGVANQFFGMSLRMYGQLRKKDWIGAFSDGLCWMVTLTGLLILVSRIFIATPERIFQAGMWLFGIGALCLVLTQAREVRNPIGRLLGGVVSLYGIMGSYGITAFIGDTLSYCRLLALGLTTSIVAMAFNLMAGMVRDVPYVGIVLFVLVLCIGHVFNFAVSVLGAFVHSMRLIYVEFFGRFYETGARPFRPLTFDSPLCILKKTGTGA
ncbi:MAG TPA: V-type ATP synthase subunit I, partial [Desulfomonilia bacterium]|nr:V-type ATP synthase subunit I [Desulfomonilia bacterium]